MPKYGPQQLVREELEDYETSEPEEDSDFFDFLCDQCYQIFSQDFVWGRSDDQVINLRWDSYQECKLCMLLCERFWPADKRLDIDNSIGVNYWLETRDSWLFGVMNIVFDISAEGKERREPLRLAIQHQHRPSVSEPEMPAFTTDLGPSTDSPESLKQVALWLDECRTTHKMCNAISSSLDFLPRRLVDIVSIQGPPVLKIVETTVWKARENAKYATLSHCWGGSTPCKLMSSNLSSYLESLPYEKFSKVFQDAVHIANKAGIRYLWIDSLCIVQDQKKDWIRESAQMGMIYKHAFLNIAATGFPDGSNGLFAPRNVLAMTPISINIETDIARIRDSGTADYFRQVEVKKGEYYLFDVDTYQRGVDKAPLNQRGWVVQERSLSLRTCHFGSSELFWECAELETSEVFHSGFSSGMPTSSSKLFIREEKDYENIRDPARFREAKHLSYGANFIQTKQPSTTKIMETQQDLSLKATVGMSAGHIRWKRVVQKYSSCDLTYSADKLIAVAGLAKDLSSYMKCAYHAGLWEDGIAHQLLWRVMKPLPLVKSSGLRGPSWSWASVDGEVSMPRWQQPDVQWLAKVLDISSRATGIDQFGQVHSGSLEMSGLLGVVRVHPQNDETECDDSNDGNLVQIRRKAHISWDNTSLEVQYGSSGNTSVYRYSVYGTKSKKKKHTMASCDVFVLPVRTMAESDGNDYDRDMLTGLLLLPIGKEIGQYRRVGVLRISEFWSENAIIPFKNKTEIISPDFFKSSERNGQYTITVI